MQRKEPMHLTLEMALDLIEDRLKPWSRDRWLAHCVKCGECRQEVETCQRLCVLMEGRGLLGVPADLVDRAIRIFENDDRPVSGRIRRVLASLVFDSFAQPALAGARGGGDARHIVLEAEGLDIHLKIPSDPNATRIEGQILLRESARFLTSATLHLFRDGECVDSTSVGAFGEFRFKEVPDLPVSLQIDLPGVMIVGTLKKLSSLPM